MRKKPTRRERDRQRHVGDILDAAEAVFAEKGYERARVSDIARRAEFSVGYLYQTWKGKEDLYVSLLESKSAEFKSFLEEKIRPASGPVETINVLIDAHLAFIDRNKRFGKLFLVETYPTEKRVITRLGTRLRRAHKEYLRLVERIIENGVKSGALADVSARDLALALEGIIIAFAKDHLERSPGSDFTRKGPVIKQIFFEPVARKAPRRASKNKEHRRQ
jgi:AcrR family transcriptional regulator